MGRICSVCGRQRPNEHFGGRGERAHTCRDCRRLPKEERQAQRQEDEIFGFMRQSHISDKNVKRLQRLRGSNDARVAELAEIVLEVAQVKPYKKRRLKVLAQERKDLLARLEETGLIDAHHS